MAWIAVAEAGELGVGQMKRIAPSGKPLLLVNAEGGYFCVDEMCSHEDFPSGSDASRAGRSNVRCMAVILIWPAVNR
jgi:nitrite reductase/ring-hydroxylating ferredoxin subunit